MQGYLHAWGEHTSSRRSKASTQKICKVKTGACLHEAEDKQFHQCDF
jgi:hypothetical protein